MSTKDTIAQLNHARNLCLADPNNLYPQIVPGLAPIIHANAELDLRRWGAEFLSETFASPVLSTDHKQKLGPKILDQLKGYLDRKDEDAAVVKSVVQTAASIYPHVFRHIISNPNDAETWQKMAAIKSNILRRMDTAPAGVRISCIKFVQGVVQVQTPGMIADPRRPEQNETSLALVPRDHPVIPPPNLEAEASGLLDRLLGALQANSGDALIVTATLNSLGSLARRRASVANKIIAAVLVFDPFTLASPTMTAKDKVMVRSMVRTTIAFLGNIIRRHPTHTLAGRMQGSIERLRQALVDVFEELSRKRAAPSEQADAIADAKRQRTGDAGPEPTQNQNIPPLPPGQVTHAQLFTLTNDQSLQTFDAQQLPIEIILQLLPPLLTSIDKVALDNAINAVRTRYIEVQSRPTSEVPAINNTAGAGAGDEDEDDYEPNIPDQEKEALTRTQDDQPVSEVLPPELSALELPPQPALSRADTLHSSGHVVRRVFDVLTALDATPAKRTQKLGLNRLAGANRDRDAWLTLISRLATRASAGLSASDDVQIADSRALAKAETLPDDEIREALLTYTISDFRRRIDVAIAWLNEEWYNDQVTIKQIEADRDIDTGGKRSQTVRPLQYGRWLSNILDGILPYLDAKDKLLIRFLSEIPQIDRQVIKRVTKLAEDPDRIGLVVMAVHYLVLYRPPVREMCLDALEELYKTYDAKSVGKLLVKWRPGAIANAETKPVVTGQGDSTTVMPLAIAVE